MKAPDKIYLNRYMIRPGMLYPAQYPADTPEFEYIRKDALMERLKKVAAEYKKRSDEGELVWQNMCGINEAISILNEM